MVGTLQARMSEEPDFEDGDASSAPRSKRKADHLHATSDARPTKKAKSPKKKILTRDLHLNTESGISTNYAHMDADLLADHLAQRTKRFQDELSLVELEERRIPVLAIRSSTDFEPDRTLDKLPDFLRKYSTPKRKPEALAQAPKAKGTPHTLVVTGAGLRAADVTRALRTFQTKDAVVAKLFAKHIKLDEAKEYVSKTRMGVGVGTPKRISDLLEAEVLSPAKIERIVIDVSHIDQKKRGILDMKELQPPLMDLLNRPQLKDRYGTSLNEIELLFF